MKHILFIVLIILWAQPLSAQKYTEYLSSAKSHLESGNIDKAISCYNVYKSMTGKVNDEFETKLNTEIANNWDGIQKADGEDYDYVGSGPSWDGHDCLQIVGLHNKYGFVDTTGKVVIPIKYDNVDGGSPQKSKEYCNNWSGDGLMSVCINNKWGYIDKNGKVVVPIIYDKVDSRCYVPSDIIPPGITRVWKDGLVGGINHIGEFLLSLEYDEIEDYYNKDLFFVKKDNKYGFLTQNIN